MEARDVPGAPPSTRDFDIVWPEGRRAALEVTTITDRFERSAMAALGKHGTGITTDRLRRRWLVRIAPATSEGRPDYPTLRRRLPELLAVLEAASVERVSCDWSDGEPPIVRDLCALHVDGASSWNSDLQPRILISSPGSATFVGPENLVKAVERELAERADVRGKLARSGHEGRHAFFWVEAFDYPAFEGLCSSEQLPDRPAVCPAEVTTVWAAATGFDGELVVWRNTPPGPWEALAGPLAGAGEITTSG